MNAHALLSAQGWRGKGHSLHKTDDSVGLSKPLLLSRKDNKSGLGTTQHFTSDQWWMSAFDEQLRGLDTTQEGRVTQTLTTGKLNSIDKGSLGKYNLYASFVRGGFLESTLPTQKREQSPPATDEPTPIPDSSSPVKQSKQERRARKEARRKQKEERAKKRLLRRLRKANSAEAASGGDPDKDACEQRANKREKRRRRQDKAATL
ncbi:hypothetical protein XA68_12239 [Ophiocordyceps unilateralis]|uniref:G-patch domain-containing protein n=1 Tax=Ophiocordyceps unilateralis TaxID=268505 RepID=A0A2A9PF47_OPHUN|nr:hypothetical protein XA68_12239 [Ophiocordyceps unilateralis]